MFSNNRNNNKEPDWNVITQVLFHDIFGNRYNVLFSKCKHTVEIGQRQHDEIQLTGKARCVICNKWYRKFTIKLDRKTMIRKK